MKDMASTSLRGIRTEQLSRQRTNNCAADGSKSGADKVDKGQQGLSVTNYAGLLSTAMLCFLISFLYSPPVSRRIRKGKGSKKKSGTKTAAGQDGKRPSMMMDATKTITNNDLAAKMDALESMLNEVMSQQASPRVPTPQVV